MSQSLPENLRKHLNKANQYKKENKKFLQNFGRKKNGDESFHSLHEEAFQSIDCLACANCCKTTS
ncbi:MAG: YkgJ family cysteine cluster protein, partial [Flavobacteriales bacterium]